jgi:hypothetical protein
MTEILKSLPPLDTVLVRTSQAPEEAAITIRRSDWTILALVNGKRDIKAIISDSKIGILDVSKTLSWMLSKNLVVDPMEVERLLKEKIVFINLLLEEFGAKGTGLGPWLELVKASLETVDKDSHIAPFILYVENQLSVMPGTKSGLGKEEVGLVWNQVAEAIVKQGQKEYGPMLAKHKYQTVCAKAKA